MRRIPTVVVALLAVLIGRTEAAEDAELFNEYLKYSREVAAKHHLIVRAEFDRDSSKAKPIAFRYDRYPEVERMQLPSGASYVRKKGARWVKSDDWGKTSKKAPASATKDFDNWIALIDAPLNNVAEVRDKSQGALRPMLVENDEDAKPGEVRFIMTRENPTGVGYPRFGFVRFQEQALLRFFGGPMRYGDERLLASIGYDFMFLVDMEVVTPTPAPKAKPEGARAKADE